MTARREREINLVQGASNTNNGYCATKKKHRLCKSQGQSSSSYNVIGSLTGRFRPAREAGLDHGRVGTALGIMACSAS